MPDIDIRKKYTYGHKQKQQKKKNKKVNPFIAIVSGLFPWSGDSGADVARKLVFLASMTLVVVCAVLIYDFYFGEHEGSDNTGYWDVDMEDETTVVYNTRPPNQTNAPGEPEIVEPPPMLNRYVELFEKNDHMVGYISIDPYINYPVLQPQDDMPADYYLNHNFERRRTSNGTIFACKFNEFSPFGRPDNTIIHGHNLQTKNMFEPLLNYRHRNDATAFQFLKDNHIIRFDTLFEPGLYKIFSVFQATINDRHGEFFPYQRQRSFPTEDDFFEYVTEVLDRSRYHTPVDLRYGDELLTLSTCDFSIGEADMRLVIVARRVRFDEIARMDTDKFINLRDNNTSRSRAGRTDDGHMRYKMFEGWYNRSNSGRGWAGREWDTSRVEGLCDWLQKTGFTGAGR